MQINSSIRSIVSNPQPVLALPAPAASDTQTAPNVNRDITVLETADTLNEISVPDSSVSMDTASLNSDSGSGNIPVKLATIIYSLNHSFDVQQQMIDILI